MVSGQSLVGYFKYERLAAMLTNSFEGYEFSLYSSEVLSNSNPAWWDYLKDGATHALESNAPSAAQFDTNGRFMPEPSPKFIAWATAQNFDADSAVAEAMRELPAKVSVLGESGDSRAIPLLRQATMPLHSALLMGMRL